MIRTIEYSVSENSVSPAMPQFAGVQGENGATEMVFVLNGDVLSKISNYLNNNKSIFWRIDYERSDGTFISSLPERITTADDIHFSLTGEYTACGGGGIMYFVISVLSHPDGECETYISVPMRIYFKDFPGAELGDKADISMLYLHTKMLRDDTYELNQTALNTYNNTLSAATEFTAAATAAVSDVTDGVEAVTEALESVTQCTTLAAQYCSEAQQCKEDASTYCEGASNAASFCAEAKTYVEARKTSSETAAQRALTAAANALSCEERMENTAEEMVSRMGSEIATLVNGKIPVSQIPEIALTGVYTAASNAEMAALNVQDGDICIRTDQNKTYVYATVWKQLLVPTDSCMYAGYSDTSGVAENSLKVNGKTIAFLTAEEYAQIVPDTNTYYFVG